MIILDDEVAAFKGVPYKEGTGVEALLDIEFIMGVAPGVHTEFWEWPDSDFCADLLNYTSTLLEPDGPLVNSISYGWQGDLAQVGCKAEMVGKVDKALSAFGGGCLDPRVGAAVARIRASASAARRAASIEAAAAPAAAPARDESAAPAGNLC